MSEGSDTGGSGGGRFGGAAEDPEEGTPDVGADDLRAIADADLGSAEAEFGAGGAGWGSGFEWLEPESLLPGGAAGVPESMGTERLLELTVAAGDWWKQFVVWGPGAELLADETLSSRYLPVHDLDGARKLLWKFGGRLTWTDAVGWRCWDGRVHAENRDQMVELICGAFADAYEQAVVELDGVFRRRAEDEMRKAVDGGMEKAEARKAFKLREKEWRGWLRDAESYCDRLRGDPGQKALLSRLVVECAVDEARFDADGKWLVVGNGVLDLDVVQRTGALDGRSYGAGVGAGVTGEGLEAARGRISGGRGAVLQGHTYKRLVTQGTVVEWRGWESECAWFDWYLARSLPSEELRLYVQKWMGAFLLGGLGGGGPKEKALVNLIGESDSGKTLLLNLMKRVWGDYVHSVPVEVFLTSGKFGDSAGYGKHEMRGKRMIVAAEPGTGRQIDDSVVKEVTGGDPITSRAPYGKYVTWKPQALVVISSNHVMKFEAADNAILRRLRPISFDISFVDRPDVPEERRLKRDLEEVIATELSGVMKWCLEGLLKYLAEGIVEPAEVTAKREEMAADVDSSLLWAHWVLEQGMVREVREDGSLVAGVGEDPALLGSVSRGELLNVTEAHEHYESWCVVVERIKEERWIRKKPAFSRTLARVWGKPVKVVGTMRFPGLVKTSAWRELI